MRRHDPRSLAVVAGSKRVTYEELIDRVDEEARALRRDAVRVLASRLDNGLAAVVTDLAALAAGITHVPLPAFFTEAQAQHVLSVTRADWLTPAEGDRQYLAANSTIPSDVAKITFTSGTTGAPKGVCLAAATMLDVAASISERTQHLPINNHLCALPFAVLLENIAGIYAPLWRGAALVASPMSSVGLTGASAFDPATLDAAVRRTPMRRASSCCRKCFGPGQPGLAHGVVPHRLRCRS